MLIPEYLTFHQEHISQIVVWSLFTAMLSLFLNACMKEGMIFEFWLNFWADRWLKKNNKLFIKFIKGKTDESINEETHGEFKTVREYKFSEVKWFFFKPFGYCIVCFNIWVSVIFIPLVSGNIIEIIGFILLSNFLTRFANEKLL